MGLEVLQFSLEDTGFTAIWLFGPPHQNPWSATCRCEFLVVAVLLEPPTEVIGHAFIEKVLIRSVENIDEVFHDKKGRNIVPALVVWGGIEPPTHGFSVHCSTN